MIKFGRSYRLLITSSRGNVTIDYAKAPFTVEFDIKRSNQQSTNVGSVRIYNLADKTRNIIRKDENTYDGTFATRLGVQFDAGYGKTLSTIFKGSANRAWSVRESVNWITQIEAFDGGDALINAKTSQTFASGTPTSKIIDAAVGDMSQYGVEKGVISSYEDSLGRGNALSGNSAQIINEYAPNAFFIDNEKAYVLKDNDCIQGSISTINSSTGLLGTPVRSKNKITFDILFEPRIKMAQIIKLESNAERTATAPLSFNGNWKVISIHHHGVISYSNGGTAITSLELWQGPGGPEAFRVVG